MEWWRNTCANLWYSPGGSGYHLTYQCLLDMPLDDIEWHAENLIQTRQRESDIIKQSGSSPKRST
jgi:hypothetical protein